MNISLENLHDTKRPKWAHFGPRKTPETAAKIRDLLENEQFKISESEAAGPPSDYGEPDALVPQTHSLPATLRGIKKIEPDMSNEELRLRELEVEVAKAHAKDYLAQAVEGQHKAEERLVETQELKVRLQESEMQTIEALKEPVMGRPSKAEVQHNEAGFTAQHFEVELQRGGVDFAAQPSNVEPQRSDVDTLRNLELQRALEAKAAAEARAAEESRKTAELQTSLFAQFAAMQAELAALKAERAAERKQEYTRASVAPTPSQNLKREDPKPVRELSPNLESVSVQIPEKPADATLTPPVMDESKVMEVAKPESAEISQSSSPNEPFIVQTQTVEMAAALLEKPDITEESVVKPTYGAFSIEAPVEEVLKVEALIDESFSVKAQGVEVPTGEALSEESMVTTVDEASPVEVEAQAAKEAPTGEALVEKEQELASESQSSSSAEYPSSYKTTENAAGLQMKREEELHPEVNIVFEDSAVSDLPLPSKAPETQGAVKEQPEVTSDEEPAPEKQEKPAVTKDDKPSRS